MDNQTNNYIKVKDKDNLLRDASSNGIVNNDITGYNEYVNLYRDRVTQIKKQNDYETQLNYLKSEISEIKDLLKKLVN
jgi:hypothetical protein